MKRGAFLACALLAGCAASPESAPPVAAPPVAAPIAALPVAPAAPVAIHPAWAPPSALDATPAAVPMPPAPPAQKPARDGGSIPRDQSGELTRNASVVCRLPEAGQRASFPFTAEAGEQSLFELAASAYSRAATGRVRIAIEDANGKVAWQSERDVAVVWRDFAAFTPEHAGTWTYSLTMLEGGYRFVLVRHSNYPALGDTALDIGTRNLVHGELPNAEAVAIFRVPVHAGEELALKLQGTREEAREEARRGATEMGAMVSRMEMQPAGGRMAGGAKLQFQRFDLEVLDNMAPLAPVGSYARFKSASNGAVVVRVRARYAAGGGGLFDLSVERPLELLRVHGVVVDADDQPLPDVEVNFLREPDADLVGSARTNPAGEYEATVLGGNLAIQMLNGEFAAADSVRIRAAADAQVDLIFQPGAKVRRR
jgi:hypothetical protein